ncbi:MAG: DUF4230 domain-containing protein [Candidatus Parcubacteria bacterium]|nr:DUF4230 domain-containing protein [Candidatus Parcubacteria bacterium]
MKYYLTLALFIIIFIAGIFFGFLIFKPQIVKEQINSQTILQTLKNEGFLITQTYILDQKVTIDKNTGVMWRDFFWGQEIEASAVMKVSSGVDLTKLNAEDVQLADKQITIKLPAIEIQSTELMGDIELKNTQGILKKVFNNDDGYNLALNKLKEQAQVTASQEKLVADAKINTQKEIERLIGLAAPNWQIKIDFK